MSEDLGGRAGGIAEAAWCAWEGTWALWREVAAHRAPQGAAVELTNLARPSAFALREHLARQLPATAWLVCCARPRQRARARRRGGSAEVFPEFWVEASPADGARLLVDAMPRAGQPASLYLPRLLKSNRPLSVHLKDFPADQGRVAVLLGVLARRGAGQAPAP